HSRRALVWLAAAGAVALASTARASAFSSSKNLLLLVANGGSGVQEQADSVTLKEFSPANVANGPEINSINLPTNTLSSNGQSGLGLILPDASGHEGQLTLSQDGHQLLLATYLCNVGTVIDPRNSSPTNASALPASIVPRVVTMIHPDGTLDSSTRL